MQNESKVANHDKLLLFVVANLFSYFIEQHFNLGPSALPGSVMGPSSYVHVYYGVSVAGVNCR